MAVTTLCHWCHQSKTSTSSMAARSIATTTESRSLSVGWGWWFLEQQHLVLTFALSWHLLQRRYVWLGECLNVCLYIKLLSCFFIQVSLDDVWRCKALQKNCRSKKVWVGYYCFRKKISWQHLAYIFPGYSLPQPPNPNPIGASSQRSSGAWCCGSLWKWLHL